MRRPPLSVRAFLPFVAVACAVVAAGDDAPPDFTGVLFTPKLAHVQGRRPVLAVLWDPHRPEQPAPPKEVVDRVLFGPRPSVADWFREVSGGRFTIERAGVLGWYDAAHPAEHYWRGDDPKDDRWSSGHVEKWTEALRRADAEFDFAAYDADKDGVLSPEELALLVVIPQAGPFGTNRAPAGRERPEWEPLVLDGCRVPVLAEWYTGAPPNLGAPAHELCHLVLGAPDLYMTEAWPFAAGDYCLMDRSYTTVHLDPFLKLKLGWLHPLPVAASGEFTLRAVETRGEALVLFDAARRPGEYFLVENRWRGSSYDAGVGAWGRGIPADGLAVWHILEDPALFARSPAPTGGEGDWGRRGIRFVRANGGAPADEALALFDKQGARLADDTAPARLAWIDGSPTGFDLTLLTAPGPEVRVRIGKKR
ncbi:MAG: M6 family metalloprotease domain-containing protein [Planctomycetes bacterium]|nr:M6 family metalloprotease domain-containing protein [Planctomycetota bacterium]